MYAGNLPGRTAALENTRCPGCGVTLVERHGFRVVRNRLAASGLCPDCGTSIPGIWGALPGIFPTRREEAVPLVHIRCDSGPGSI